MTVELHLGDCLDVLKTLPDNSVDCCVTSPPYFGLRDYGNDAQIGLEETPDAYVAKLVAVFREVKRVLRDDGTLWLNLGDSYASATKGSGGMNSKKLATKGAQNFQAFAPRKIDHGLKEKDLIGIPWRVAFALQADGWWLRQDIIWHKPNPMPESVRDRCTKSHEYVFLLSKSARYYFDADAVSEPAIYAGDNRGARKDTRRGTMCNSMSGKTGITRNRRSVWTVATTPYKGAHFATYPPKLIEPCILAGCPLGGVVLDPFTGSGTTLAVAVQYGRNGIGIELNPDYIDLARARIAAAQGEPKQESIL